jgi:hypothetical protein
MRPGPWCPAVVGCRLAAIATVSAGVAAGGLAPIALAVHALASLGRVPRRWLALEIAIGAAILAFLVGNHTTIAAIATAAMAIALLSIALAPESARLRMNGIDRFLYANDYPEMRLSAYYSLELDRPLDTRALAAAALDLHREVPMLRSFVRVALFSMERFVARKPFAASLLDEGDAALDDGPRSPLHRAIDLRSEPPFRVFHRQRPDGGATLALAVHHAAIDGEGTIVIMDWLVQRYTERVTGATPAPLQPWPQDGLRLREVIRRSGRSWLWMVNMLRRHVKLRGSVGQHNADLIDPSASAVRSHARHHVAWMAPPVWDHIASASHAAGVSQNDLLVAAALRAFVITRRTLGRNEQRPVKIMMPVNIRSRLGMQRGLQNFISTITPTFDPTELEDSPERTAQLVHERVRELLELESVVGTPMHLGFMSLVLMPWGMRAALRRFDRDARQSYFSFIFTHLRNPPTRNPHGADIRDTTLGAPVSSRPPVSVAIGHERGGLRITIAYRHPLVSDDAARRLADNLIGEISVATAMARGPSLHSDA